MGGGSAAAAAVLKEDTRLRWRYAGRDNLVRCGGIRPPPRVLVHWRLYRWPAVASPARSGACGARCRRLRLRTLKRFLAAGACLLSPASEATFQARALLPTATSVAKKAGCLVRAPLVAATTSDCPLPLNGSALHPSLPCSLPLLRPAQHPPAPPPRWPPPPARSCPPRPPYGRPPAPPAPTQPCPPPTSPAVASWQSVPPPALTTVSAPGPATQAGPNWEPPGWL